MFLHHFVCSVHFPTVQKHTGFETIPHLYYLKNDKRVKPANGFQPAFSGHSLYLFIVPFFYRFLECGLGRCSPVFCFVSMLSL